MECPFLDLPPEIRMRIFKCFLLFHRPLKLLDAGHAGEDNQHSAAEEADDEWLDDRLGCSNLKPIDLSIFLVNRKIHIEAADVFYSGNKFNIHYDRFCRCTPPIRKIRIENHAMKYLKIQGVDFVDYRCKLKCGMCARKGFGMMSFLKTLPNLKFMTIVFASFDSFITFIDCLWIKQAELGLRNGKPLVLVSKEIGRLELVGLDVRVQFRLPVLLRTWPLALDRIMQGLPPVEMVDGDDNYLIDGLDIRMEEFAVYKVIWDILSYAIMEEQTTYLLKPFFEKTLGYNRLTINQLDPMDRAGFTTALAKCIDELLAEEFDEDFGLETLEMADRRDLVPIF